MVGPTVAMPNPQTPSRLPAPSTTATPPDASSADLVAAVCTALGVLQAAGAAPCSDSDVAQGASVYAAVPLNASLCALGPALAASGLATGVRCCTGGRCNATTVGDGPSPPITPVPGGAVKGNVTYDGVDASGSVNGGAGGGLWCFAGVDGLVALAGARRSAAFAATLPPNPPASARPVSASAARRIDPQPAITALLVPARPHASGERFRL